MRNNTLRSKKSKMRRVDRLDELVQEPTEQFERKRQTIKFKPKNEEQQELVDKIRNNIIVFVAGKAGVGKTCVTCAMALDQLNKNLVEKIIITRSAVEAGGESLGHLPGDINAKIGQYLVPFFDEFKKFITPQDLKLFLDTGVIEICPIAYLRGRTLEKSFIIVDEVQNTNKAQLKMILTRLGENSKLVLLADPEQSDIKEWEQGAFDEAIDRLHQIRGVVYHEMFKSVRHPLLDEIITALKGF